MTKKLQGRDGLLQPKLRRQLAAKVDQKIKARGKPRSEMWLGIGMMGLIGWSVVVPTLLGSALGIWIDSRHPGQYSWTLMLLIFGLFMGCLNAWHWVGRENRDMNDEQENSGE